MNQPDDLPEITTASVSALLERIAAGVATDADYSTLRQLLLAAPQRLTQLGKYNIQIGEGHDIQIGDRTYGDINDDALQAIVEAIQQAVKAAAPQVQQTVSGNQNQVIAEMRGGTAINTVQGEVHIHQPAPPTAPALTTFFGVSYPRNPYFTGREETLNQLQQQLNQNRTVAINQIQAISGLGGIGKTQTAVEYAYRCYDSAPRPYDWVLWVRADTEANLISDFAALATQLQLPAAHLKPEEQIPAVQQWLATHDRWLLIFDNADTPEWLQPFLPNRSQGCVLLTSRADVFDQVGIANPLTLDALSNQEAVDFLFKRVGRDPTAPEQQAAIYLATELGNLPLALEQAGAFILRQKLSFQTYLSTYRKRRLQQLEKVKPQTGKYPASVLTTWSLNFQAVETANAASAEVLRLSAVVAPDAIPYRLLLQGAAHLGDQLALSLQAEDEAEAVMAVSEVLTPLSQYSLIQWEPEQAQYSMHRMVQAVVQDGLTQETRQLWVTRAVRALDATFPAVEFQTWVVCDQLLPHALRVIQQANAQGDGSEALARLLNQTASYLQAQGRYDEAEPLYRQALELRRELLGERHPDVATSLNNLAGLYRAQGRYDEAEPLYRQALELSRELLGERHPDVATSLNNLAYLYQSQGRYDEAEPLYRQALELSRELLGERHPQVAGSLNNLAYLYQSQGRYDEAEPLYRQALELSRELLGERHPDVATSLNNLAYLYQSQGRYDEAEPLYRQALELSRELLGERHPQVAGSLNNLAYLYQSQGRYDEAEPLCRQALELRRELLGERHPDVATSLNNLAGLYRAQGRYDEAEPLYRQALELRRELLGERHPDVATSLNNLAGLYRAQGRYDEAEPLYRQALELSRELLGERHPDVATSLNNLAYLYQSQGRYDEAEPLYRQALELSRELLGERHPDVATSLNNLAYLYQSQGRYDEAEPLYRQALELSRELLGERHPQVAGSLNNLAYLYQSQGRYDEAEPLYRQALELRRELLGERHPQVATSLNNLAGLYESQGRYDEAEPLYLEALAMLAQAVGTDHPNFQTVFGNFVAFLQGVVGANQTDQLSDHPLVKHLLAQIGVA